MDLIHYCPVYMGGESVVEINEIFHRMVGDCLSLVFMIWDSVLMEGAGYEQKVQKLLFVQLCSFGDELNS